jgi:hypothetical protein
MIGEVIQAKQKA